MTRQLAQDALRYVTRTYADEAGQYAKMVGRHGLWEWAAAYITALHIYSDHGDRDCMAVLHDKVERALRGKGNGGEPV